MNVLIACEYSGIVRDAFIRANHNAMSCDILPTESPGPHYQGDVRDVLEVGWDLIIAHPPCTRLTNAGVRWLHTLGVLASYAFHSVLMRYRVLYSNTWAININK